MKRYYVNLIGHLKNGVAANFYQGLTFRFDLNPENKSELLSKCIMETQKMNSSYVGIRVTKVQEYPEGQGETNARILFIDGRWLAS